MKAAMAIIRSILSLSLALALTGCGTATTNTSDDVTITLAEAASSIGQSLTDLRAVEVSASPPVNDKRMPYPTSYDMNAERVSLEWSGPIEPLLQRIATMKDYKFHVIGTHPAIPVLVSITAKNTPLGYILRDINFQAGNKASLWVYPGVRIIELRYGKA